MVHKAKMKLERLTKGAALYKNVRTGPQEAITNIYLRKTGMRDEIPDEIEITIKPSSN